MAIGHEAEEIGSTRNGQSPRASFAGHDANEVQSGTRFSRVGLPMPAGWYHWREVRQFAEPAAIMAPAESGNDISPGCSNLPWPDRRNDMDSASQGGSKLYERAIN